MIIDFCAVHLPETLAASCSNVSFSTMIMIFPRPGLREIVDIFRKKINIYIYILQIVKLILTNLWVCWNHPTYHTWQVPYRYSYGEWLIPIPKIPQRHDISLNILVCSLRQVDAKKNRHIPKSCCTYLDILLSCLTLHLVEISNQKCQIPEFQSSFERISVRDLDSKARLKDKEYNDQLIMI